MDLIVLLVAVCLAVGLAFWSRAIRDAWLLVPVRWETPREVDSNGLVPFRFQQFKALRDSSTYKPRLLLALLIFVLLALALKLLVARDGDWHGFLVGMSWCVLAFVVLGGSFSNTLGLGLMLLLFVGVAKLFHFSASGTGLWMGLLLGGYAGIFVFRNYIALIQKKRLEIEHRESQGGGSIGTLGLWVRRLHLFGLAFVPVMVGYKVVAYWWKGAQFLEPSGGLVKGGWALLVLSLGVGLNVTLFLAPLFREMIEKTSITTAADFTSYAAVVSKEKVSEGTALHIEDAEAQEDHMAMANEAESAITEPGYIAPDAEEELVVEAEPTEDEDEAAELPRFAMWNVERQLLDHLDAEGRWRSFQRSQVFPILMVVLYLSINFVSESLQKFGKAGFIPPTTLPYGWTLNDVLQCFAGIVWWADLAFLMGALAFWGNQFVNTGKDQRTAQVENTTAMWEATRAPTQTTLYCTKLRNEPLLKIAERK